MKNLKIKNYLLLAFLGAALLFTACEEDDVDTSTTLPELESTIRFEKDGESYRIESFATFSQGVDDFSGKQYLEFEIQDNILGQEKFYMVLRMERDENVFDFIEVNEFYPLKAMFSDEGSEPAFQIGLTWFDDDRNSTLFSQPDEDAFFRVTSKNSNRIEGRVSFTMESPLGEVIRAPLSIVIARPN